MIHLLLLRLALAQMEIYRRGVSFNHPVGVFVTPEVAKKADTALKRIEGQVRGVSKMLDENRYCIDIVTQIEAVRAALAKVEGDLLRQHLQHCVHKAMASKDSRARERVIEELIDVFRR